MKDMTEIYDRHYSPFRMQNYNNGNPETIVPYEVILFDNGIIVKKSPHPVIATHIVACDMFRAGSGLGHDQDPMGFNFITFHYIDAPHEQRADFVETMNVLSGITNEPDQRWLYEACSDLKLGDGECPRFRDKDDAFNHCMHLIKKEFGIKPVENNNRCIKKLYKQPILS